MTAAVLPFQRRTGALLESFTTSDQVPVQVREHRDGVETCRVGLDRWQLAATAVPAYVQAVLVAVQDHPDADGALVADLLDVLALHSHGGPDDVA